MEDFKGFNIYVNTLIDYMNIAEELSKKYSQYPTTQEELKKYIKYIQAYVSEILPLKEKFKGFVCIRGSVTMLRELLSAMDYFNFVFDKQEVRELIIEDSNLNMNSNLYLSYINYLAFSRQIVQPNDLDLPSEMIALIPIQLREILW